ncbi:Citrate-binding protein [Camellia lanceoleosa]|uniref:Citrate-binding protein n=1 Tax=Camellia lanceoleosa TaxID=1840588 RepID=A0ACC0GVN0_9ERIC|nr:Citrate-binding protein [Camellia lanceoleosa]
MWTGYKEQPKNAWETKGLALPTIFAIDESFRHNEDTKWAVKELERLPAPTFNRPLIVKTSVHWKKAPTRIYMCSVYAPNSDKSTACPSSCAYSSGTAPAPFQMTSEQYEQLCQEVRGLRHDVIAYRTQSQQDFLEFRSQYHTTLNNPTDGFTNIPLTESNFKLQRPYDVPLEQRYSFQNGVHRQGLCR